LRQRAKEIREKANQNEKVQKWERWKLASLDNLFLQPSLFFFAKIFLIYLFIRKSFCSCVKEFI